MDVTPVPRIDGAMLFRAASYVDERGFFCRTFDADVIRASGVDPPRSFSTASPVRCAAWCADCTYVAETAKRSWSDAHTA